MVFWTFFAGVEGEVGVVEVAGRRLEAMAMRVSIGCNVSDSSGSQLFSAPAAALGLVKRSQ
jgi:hypothetical protein